MLQLREDHMAGFEKVAIDGFIERGVQHLRRNLPAQTAAFSDEQLRQRILACMDRANAYGLTTERHVMTFVDATYLSGENFDTSADDPRAHEVLTDPLLSPDAKAMMLLLVIPIS